jgi:hypothetical protein
MVITSLLLPKKEAGRLKTLVKFQPEFTLIDGQFSAGNNSMVGLMRRRSMAANHGILFVFT